MKVRVLVYSDRKEFIKNSNVFESIIIDLDSQSVIFKSLMSEISKYYFVIVESYEKTS